MMVPQNKV